MAKKGGARWQGMEKIKAAKNDPKARELSVKEFVTQQIRKVGNEPERLHGASLAPLLELMNEAALREVLQNKFGTALNVEALVAQAVAEYEKKK